MLTSRMCFGEEPTALYCQPLNNHCADMAAALPDFTFDSNQKRVPVSSARPATTLSESENSDKRRARCVSSSLTNVLLGRGRQGTVWLAKDAAGRARAVKCIEVAAAAPNFIHEIIAALHRSAAPAPVRAPVQVASPQRKIVETEARLWSRLRHAAVVRLDGVECARTERGTAEFRFHMEHMNAGSLASFAKGCYPAGRLPESDVRWFLRPVLQALHYIHAEHVAHLDLKAENILLTWDDETPFATFSPRPLPFAKLADFGCARDLHPCGNCESCGNGENPAPLGTPGFIAPEIAGNGGGCSACDAYGTAADLWSFGCTILQLLHGAPPVTPGAHPLSILYETALHPERIHRFIPAEKDTSASSDHCTLIELLNSEDEAVSISPELRSVLMLCLNAHPAERATAAELLEHPFFQNGTPTADDATDATIHDKSVFNCTTSTWSTMNEGLSEADDDNEEEDEAH